MPMNYLAFLRDSKDEKRENIVTLKILIRCAFHFSILVNLSFNVCIVGMFV